MMVPPVSCVTRPLLAVGSPSTFSRRLPFAMLAVFHVMMLLALSMPTPSFATSSSTTSSTSYIIPQRPPHRLPRNQHFTYSHPMVGPPRPRAFETLLYKQAVHGKVNWHLVNPKLLKKIRSGYLQGLTRAFFGKHLNRLILGSLLSRKNSPYKTPQLSKEEKANRGREAQQVPTFRTGLDLSVGAGPSLAAMNFSFYRHHSVVPGSWVDWRLFLTTPVQTQYGCDSCWAMTATDALAHLTSILNWNTPVVLSTQQACSCGIGLCCQGGWPEWVFAYVAYNLGIANETTFPYAANEQTCPASSSLPLSAQLTGWEWVPSGDILHLKRAVAQQPVIVFVEASSPDFTMYRGGIFNGSCRNEVNHAMLLVGFGTDPDAGDYWILKNTWGDWWGDNGYMYLPITAGTGTCGILQVPAVYPVNYPGPQNALFPFGKLTSRPTLYPSRTSQPPWWSTWLPNAASNSTCGFYINPCGGGTCYVKAGLARCLCPSGFTERQGVPTATCVPTSPCSAAINPCGPGTCQDDEGGLYTCTCIQGFVIGARIDGSTICVPAQAFGGSTTYTVMFNDTCASVALQFNLTVSKLTSYNPFIDCTAALPMSTVLSISNATVKLVTGCVKTARINSYYKTCQSIANAFWGGNATKAYDHNPGLRCASVLLYQQICVLRQAVGLSAFALPCGAVYTTTVAEDCNGIIGRLAINGTDFYLLNPQLDCSKTIPAGTALCSSRQLASSFTCSKNYTVVHADSCAAIWNTFNLTQITFMQLNPGLQCGKQLQVGQKVCIKSSKVNATTRSKGSSSIPYVVQSGDTFTSISLLFFNTCGTSANQAAICTANSMSTCTTDQLYVGRIISVPCQSRVGVDCGCTASITVCGSDYVTYPSWCHAVCNFATPNNATYMSGGCNTCAAACTNRVGLMASTAATFQAGCNINLATTFCSYPTWVPSSWSMMASTPCQFMKQNCLASCRKTANTMTGNRINTVWRTTNTSCYQNCECSPRTGCYNDESVECPVNPGV